MHQKLEREGVSVAWGGRETSESLANYDGVIFEFVLHGHHRGDGARICVVVPRHVGDDDEREKLPPIRLS
jgi:hypothetical protein